MGSEMLRPIFLHWRHYGHSRSFPISAPKVTSKVQITYLFRFSYIAAFTTVRYLCLFMFATVIASAGQRATPQPDHVVIKAVANMYREPNLDTEVVSQAIYGSNLSVVEASGEWMKVRTGDDYVGWMR